MSYHAPMTKTESKYYVLNGETPVRVRFNEDGLRIGADVPDPTKGDLVKDARVLFTIDHGDDVEEITSVEFEQRSNVMLGRTNE